MFKQVPADMRPAGGMSGPLKFKGSAATTGLNAETIDFGAETAGGGPIIERVQDQSVIGAD